VSASPAALMIWDRLVADDHRKVGWTTASALAARLGLSHGEVRMALARLAAGGRVTRTVGEEDGRLLERFRAVGISGRTTDAEVAE
jgi:DNA-binding MarR family transcriptional regulator